MTHTLLALALSACFVYMQVNAEKNKWQKYLDKIHKALTDYKPCNLTDPECSCHADVIDDDLEPFSGGITKDQFDSAKSKGSHYQIIEHRLYRDQRCYLPARCRGIEHFMKKILPSLPDMEFIVNVRDYPQSPKHDMKWTLEKPLPVFSFSKARREMYDIMYPAWTFWEGGPAGSSYPKGLGRWDKQREIIHAKARPILWKTKKNKAFFRGVRTSEERDPLILLSRAEPHLADAKYTAKQTVMKEEDTLGAEPAEEVRLEDHCIYKYLFNFRGVAASFRFKHLFLCDSLVFHVGEDWLEFFYPALKPWVHYIPVKKDMSDMKELLMFAKENDDIAKEIATRGRDFIMQHLRMEDVSCYWEKLLKKYERLTKWKPQKEEGHIEIRVLPQDEL